MVKEEEQYHVTLQAAVYCRRENVNQVISIVRSDVEDV